MKAFRIVSVLIVLAMAVSACASAATPAPTTVPAPTTAPTPVAQVPADALTQKGKLLICTDAPYPPQEFFDENGDPKGLDIDMGAEIGSRLGLKTVFVNSVFDTIIAAVSAGKCDMIISAMNITPERNKQVSMIPYFIAGQAFVVAKGNPQNIKTTMDLCGKSVAAESGTTEAAYINGTDTYQGKGLSDACTAASKEAINMIVTQKDTDALQQLQTGKVVAYFADSPVAAYYTVEHPDQFELVPQVLNSVPEGINMPCGQADCTNAALPPLGQAVKTALKSMMDDGTYLKILKTWNLQDSAVTLQ
jgi:polar amino acid transport system substrate-binding protein